MPAPTAESRPGGAAERAFAFLRLHSGLIVLLTVSLLMRIMIYRSVNVRITTDSVTYLVLQDLHPVRTPGYPLFMNIIFFVNDLFSLTPNALRLVIFVQLFLLGMVNTYLIYRFSRILTRSAPWSLALGLIYNLDYFVIGFEFILLTETLALTLLGLTLLFYWKIFAARASAPYLAGLFSVGLFLTRPTFAGLFICLVGLTLLIHRRQIVRGPFLVRFARPLAIFLVINLVGLGAWSLRNKVKYNFFGLSTILPYQLGYYTQPFCQKYKMGSDEELDKYAKILIEEKGSPYNFGQRVAEEFKLQPAQVSRILLKLDLKLITENFGDYLRLVPQAASDYYSYSRFWTRGYDRRILARTSLLARVFGSFRPIFSFLFNRPVALLFFVLILPIVFLVARRKDNDTFHLTWLLEGTIHYSFVISVLLTNNGVNNQRFRAPVEPFILLVFFGALFLLGSDLARKLRKSRRAK